MLSRQAPLLLQSLRPSAEPVLRPDGGRWTGWLARSSFGASGTIRAVSSAYLVTLLAAAIVVVVEAVLLVDWLQRRGAAPVGAVRERSNLALDLLWLLAPLALLTVLVVLTVRAAAGAEGLGLGVAGGS